MTISFIVKEITNSVLSPNIWWAFAVNDTHTRFRRSLLGPFWMTMSMSIFLAALGFVFSKLFNLPVGVYLPHVGTGLVFWTFFVGLLTESCICFTSYSALIKNVPMPLTAHYLRLLGRHIIALGANSLVIVVIFATFVGKVTPYTFLIIPGFILFFLNCAWMGLFLAITSTRFRDVEPMVTSILQVLFFLTPIFWLPSTLPDRLAFIELNPLYHMIEAVRAPYLGNPIDVLTWITLLVMLIVGWVATIFLYQKTYRKIVFWV